MFQLGKPIEWDYLIIIACIFIIWNLWVDIQELKKQIKINKIKFVEAYHQILQTS